MHMGCVFGPVGVFPLTAISENRLRDCSGRPLLSISQSSPLLPRVAGTKTLEGGSLDTGKEGPGSVAVGLG